MSSSIILLLFVDLTNNSANHLLCHIHDKGNLFTREFLIVEIENNAFSLCEKYPFERFSYVSHRESIYLVDKKSTVDKSLVDLFLHGYILCE